MSLLGFATMCVLGSFLIGVRTAGDVQPFARSEAQQANILGSIVSGDMDGNGTVNVQDVLLLLQIIKGDVAETKQAHLADPNGDGHLTIEDAIVLLRSLPPL